MKIKKKDFKDKIVSTMIYIYKIDKPDTEGKRKIYFYKYDEEKKEFIKYSASYDYYAKAIYNRSVSAYSGTLVENKDETYLDDGGFVVPYIQDGKYYLSTVRDDSKDNNLVNLFEYYKV